jgi:hypothetical protein
VTEYVRLEDCPPGTFVYENRSYVRTAYGEAYDCQDGSHFWGLPDLYLGSKEMDDLMKARCDIMVRPLA